MNRLRTALAAAALAATCAAACAAAPSARNLVVSDESPALTLRVAPDFAPLPPLRFPIENLTNAERRIFVDADADRRVERMVVVQFERVQPGSDFRFVFPSTPPRRFGDQVYRAGAFAYDEQQAAAEEPSREAARTRAFLTDRGFSVPRYWRVGRLARVSDPAGLSEVIIFYFENGDRAFAVAPPPRDEDGDFVVDEAERERLLSRLESVVEVLDG